MEGNYLRFIDFKDIEVWDVKRQNFQKNTFKFSTIKLSKILSKTQVEWVNIQDDKEYPILGVRANGKGVYINRIATGSELTMKRYQKSKKGLLFYCKVRTVNGQWGIVYPEYENTYASSNMQYLQVNYDKINPKFLELLLSVRKITNEWDKNAIGADGRHFTLSTLLNLEIPLPTLQEQQAIVDAYFSKINKASQLEIEANNIDKEIEKYLFDELGISIGNKNEKKKGLNLVEFKDVLEWGTDKLLSSSDFESKQFKLKSLSKYEYLVEDVFRGKNPKYTEKSDKYILNQKCNRWNKIELEFAKTVVAEWYNNIEQKFFTKEGDIIINSTGEGTIGRASYVSKYFEGLAYDSHILLLRLNSNIFNPELFVELFNSDFGQSQVNQIKSAQATKQTELGVNNLMKIEIPVVQDIEKQKIIVEEIKLLKQRVSDNINKIEQLNRQANEAFERAIFQ